MKHIYRGAGLAVAICLALIAGNRPALAQHSLFAPSSLVGPESLLHACCDDYCAKPAPCIRAYCGGCAGEGYCRKPFPDVPCFPMGCGVADYCRKPWPELCRPLNGDYYGCENGSVRCANPGVSRLPQPGIGDPSGTGYPGGTR
jgi:hypothetical protein